MIDRKAFGSAALSVASKTEATAPSSLDSDLDELTSDGDDGPEGVTFLEMYVPDYSGESDADFLAGPAPAPTPPSTLPPPPMSQPPHRSRSHSQSHSRPSSVQGRNACIYVCIYVCIFVCICVCCEW